MGHFPPPPPPNSPSNGITLFLWGDCTDSGLSGMCLFLFDILFGFLVLYLAHLFHSAAPTASSLGHSEQRNRASP